MSATRVHPLLTLDPELGRLLGEERAAAALAHLQVAVATVGTGRWVPEAAELEPPQIGFLILDGIVIRELLVEDTVSAELLGPGDVVRPAVADGAGDRLLPHSVRWSVLSQIRVARLDARLSARLAAWPEVNAALIDRLNAHAQRLATTQAISQLNGVDRRLHALLWHLAERWGRMTRDGVVVPLPLSHRMLSRLVGARRPSVSTALAALARRGEVVRQPDETWLLTGEPIGLPVEATHRVVPIRRRLIGAAASDAAPRPAGSGAAADRAAARLSYAEVEATVRRLHLDTEDRMAAITATAATSRRLLAAIDERRRSEAPERGVGI